MASVFSAVLFGGEWLDLMCTRPHCRTLPPVIALHVVRLGQLPLASFVLVHLQTCAHGGMLSASGAPGDTRP